MRSITIFIIMTINLIIQSTILQPFKVIGVLPNTTLVLIVVFSILFGGINGAIIGLIAGLVQDIIVGSFIGLNAMIYLLIGLSIGKLEKNIFKDNSMTPVFFTIISTSVYHVLFSIIMYVSNFKFSFWQMVQDVIIIEIIYNSIISIVIYKLIYHLFKHPNLKHRAR